MEFSKQGREARRTTSQLNIAGNKTVQEHKALSLQGGDRASKAPLGSFAKTNIVADVEDATEPANQADDMDTS